MAGWIFSQSEGILPWDPLTELRTSAQFKRVWNYTRKFKKWIVVYLDYFVCKVAYIELVTRNLYGRACQLAITMIDLLNCTSIHTWGSVWLVGLRMLFILVGTSTRWYVYYTHLQESFPGMDVDLRRLQNNACIALGLWNLLKLLQIGVLIASLFQAQKRV